MVFPDGRAVLGFGAFHGHARAHDFRQAVDVQGGDAHACFDGAAQFGGPRLGAEDAQAQGQFVRVDALALDFIGDVEHVGRRDHDDVRLEILDQLHLFFGLATGHRDHRTAQAFGAVVRAEAAGEQAVAVGNVHFVATMATSGADRARNHVGPGVDVVLGVADHGRFAGGAAGRVQAHDVVHRHGKHAVGVVVPQVGLGGEREFRQVVQGLDVVRVHAQRIEALTVQRHVVVGVVQAPAQALQLMLAQLVDAGGFQRVQHRVQHGLGNWHVHVFTRIVFVFQPFCTRALSACPKDTSRLLGNRDSLVG
ncbi:hypothetical protein D9M70_86500 [compost metagenome]